MIGDGWNDEPSVRPGPPLETAPGRRRVAVVTGTRAEFGLLRPVMNAVKARRDGELLVIAAGSHLIAPAETYREVKAEFFVSDAVPMQIAGQTGRAADVQALGRGIERFGRAFERLAPDWVVVLGDRIEAFAAASAGSVGGYAVAHLHGGDRAEGVADEAMRHAITKLAHLHFPATALSAERIARMGERPQHIHVVGSPALDGLASVEPLEDGVYEKLGRPHVVVLMHPVGRTDEQEEAVMAGVLEAARSIGKPLLVLHPNFDPGREGIVRAIRAVEGTRSVVVRTHLPRSVFLGLLKRLAGGGGVLVGNSSGALIEGAALRVRAVDIGPRQSGRERAGNVVPSGEQPDQIARAMAKASALDLSQLAHPFGDGLTGPRVAERLATTNPHDPALLRKHCAY
ncbi:MAG: UDP-N-acetylglucosamine 2-epimerase (hydrolyzing) [Phycisphaeraceae bacterium]|nr:UDP-N-acetylglucosamine 2-epimerase (hydrolyzing) [Phycisphaeraceae bacterium]